MVRAVSPGKFVMPGATIEDMYRPELRANTDAGKIEIQTPGTGPTAAKAAAPAANDQAAPGENTSETSASGVTTRSVQTIPVQKDGTIGKAN